MSFIAQTLPDVFLYTPEIHFDERGCFFETFRRSALAEATGLNIDFVQGNESRSALGVLRGLHYQRPPYAQSKLVSVVQGSVLDVAVDIRHGSPCFGQVQLTHLDAELRQHLFIPRGFAHGFLVLSSSATVNYLVDNYYSPSHEAGICFNDPTLAIDWPLLQAKIRLSPKDLKLPSIQSIQSGFEFGKSLYE